MLWWEEIQDLYDTYAFCKYDSRKGKTPSDLEVLKSKITQEDKENSAHFPSLFQ